MAKVMLVEDDNNLREIYEARLAAEGYEIISAADGEAALALAIKEKPDLIISDIMMPKVSGFDMLDILRSTTETKGTKIIMMTALNQAEDKAKAEKLGADLYLVKSQVTLEDVVRSAKGLLGEETPLSVRDVPVQAPASPAPVTAQTTTSLVANAPAVAVPAPTPPPQPAPPTTIVPTTPPAQPVATTPPAESSQSTPAVPVAPTATEPQATTQAEPSISASTTADEEAALQKQIEQYISDETPAVPEQTAPPNAVIPGTDTTAAVASPTTTEPSTAPQTVPVTVTTPAPAAPVAPIPSSMAQPPSSMAANTPAAGDPGTDRPAGEQVLVKSASADTSVTNPGIDASVSGRKKVINPINDIITSGPNLDALAAKEGEGVVPEMNTVVTPEGTTLSATNGTPTMNDVVAPQPQTQEEAVPQQPLPPPVA